MKKIGLVLTFVLLVAGFAACGDQAKPEEQVSFNESKCPIEVTSTSKTISPIPTFILNVKNISPYNVTGFNAGAIFFDEKGKPLSTTPQEIPFDGVLEPLTAGSESELQTIGEEKAVSLKVVIKDCVYTKMNPVDKIYGELPYKWTNPGYDKEIKKLTGN